MLRRGLAQLAGRATAARMDRTSRCELDFDYLLDKANLQKIKENITNRKQVGDIELVHRLWSKLEQMLISPSSLPADSTKLRQLWDQFYAAALEIPNRTDPRSPIGNQHRTVAVVGEAQKFSFPARTAEQTANHLRLMRGHTADICTFAGEKAYYLLDNLAVLEKALIDYALDTVVKKRGFELIVVPDIINVDVAEQCGLTSRTQLNIVYNCKNRPDYCLSGTAEMGVAAYLRNRHVEIAELSPKRFAAVSRCYRPEVATGKVARGLYRVHEFTKVEMFGVTVDDITHSDRMLEELTDIQRSIYDGLELHYKVLDMSTHELGAPAFRKFDIEAWMPARNIYGEVSSASNCSDYQSRRLNVKYATNDGQRRFVHTVNGTACATSRLIIALLEQHQQKNGLVRIPSALLPFFNNWKELYPSRSQLKMMSYNPKTELGDR